MSPADRTRLLRWSARLAVLAVLALVASRVGTGPFLAGLRTLTPLAVLAALAGTAVATLAAAWRWTTIARALGLAIPLRAGVSAYYRSQLLNTALPGGIAGDLARGLSGARGERAIGLRAVAWDRGAGQAVQLVVLAGVLAITAGVLGGAVVAVGGGGVLLVALLARGRAGGGRVARGIEAVRRDLLAIITLRGALVPILVGSVVVCLVHAGLFVLAAVLTGAAADPGRLLPLALIVQAALVLPTGFGGLGTRESAAAAVFAAAGLGAAHGVSAGVAAGVLGLLALLPGAVPLVADAVRRPGRRRTTRHAVLR